MEKRQLYFFLFLALVWLGWMKYVEIKYPKKPAPKPPVVAANGEKEAKPEEDEGAVAKIDVKPAVSADDSAPPDDAQPEPATPAQPEVPLRDDLMLGKGLDSDFNIYARLSNRGGVVTRLQLNQYKNEHRDGPMVLLQEPVPSFVLTLVDGSENLKAKTWDVVHESPEAITFRTVTLDGALQIEKRFRLDPDRDTIQLEVAMKNLSPEKPLDKVIYQLTTGNGLPVEGAWFTSYFRNAVVMMTPAEGYPHLELEDSATIASTAASNGKQTVFSATPIRFAGIVSQYFASVVVQEADPLQSRTIQSATPVDLDAGNPKLEPALHNITMLLDSSPVALKPEAEVVHKYLLYNGPKDQSTLARYAEFSLPELVHYPNVLGLPIRYIAPVMVGILNFFHSITFDYGVSIILLTVLVRSCMFPLTFKQTQSMQRMQALQPKMQEIREKYANDKEKLNRALMDLYAKEKVNPLAGCLPMLFQFPIFIGLWQALSNSFSLRQSSFLWDLTWIKDLAAPDQLFQFPFPLPFLGPFFNLLPVIAVGQMILQMRYMSPPATTPEQEMQKKVMSFMMIFMGFMFFKVPAGLCVYIITSGAWSLAERKLLPKTNPPGAAAAPTAPPKETGGTGNGATWISPVKPKKKDKSRR